MLLIYILTFRIIIRVQMNEGVNVIVRKEFFHGKFDPVPHQMGIIKRSADAEYEMDAHVDIRTGTTGTEVVVAWIFVTLWGSSAASRSIKIPSLISGKAE